MSESGWIALAAAVIALCGLAVAALALVALVTFLSVVLLVGLLLAVRHVAVARAAARGTVRLASRRRSALAPPDPDQVQVDLEAINARLSGLADRLDDLFAQPQPQPEPQPQQRPRRWVGDETVCSTDAETGAEIDGGGDQAGVGAAERRGQASTRAGLTDRHETVRKAS